MHFMNLRLHFLVPYSVEMINQRWVLQIEIKVHLCTCGLTIYTDTRGSLRLNPSDAGDPLTYYLLS